MQIEVGKVIPIKAQMRDGQAGLTVMATIVDDVGAFLESIKLSDVGGGLYISNDFKMPDVHNVTVVVGVTELDKNDEPYAKGSQTFYSKPKVLPPEKEIIGEMTERLKTENIVQGVLSETETIE